LSTFPQSLDNWLIDIAERQKSDPTGIRAVNLDGSATAQILPIKFAIAATIRRSKKDGG
jgi:hypothetical protein